MDKIDENQYRNILFILFGRELPTQRAYPDDLQNRDEVSPTEPRTCTPESAQKGTSAQVLAQSRLQICLHQQRKHQVLAILGPLYTAAESPLSHEIQNLAIVGK